MKWLVQTGLLVLFVGVAYLTGPSVSVPDVNTKLPQVTPDLVTLENEINRREQAIAHIKPDNEARIVWTDSAKKSKTPYSLVYLHGFSASQGEGDPIHREFALRYGCNLYLSRLHGHGLEGAEGMSGIIAEELLDSAKEAIAVGQAIGEKVILMSCSTGSTLALYLASGNPDIYALINYSPNIDLYDPNSFLLVKPWGLQLARLVTGSAYHTFDGSPGVQQYWNTKYRLEAIVQLKSLVDATMHEKTFAAIRQPLLMAYYYKDETHQDDVVSVPRMLEMFDQLGTPAQLKRKVALPSTGVHGLCSKFWSKDLDIVREVTFSFAEEVLRMTPIAAEKRQLPAEAGLQ